MAWKVGDIVDIRSGSETDQKLNDADADPKGQIELVLEDEGITFDKTKPLPLDALWGWKVASSNGGEIRKTLKIEGRDIEILMSVVNIEDLTRSGEERRNLSKELIKKDLPRDLIRNIGKYAGKQRTRRGKKKSRKSRKLRKTRGRK